MKNTNPTPRSITQRNPIKMSPSSNNILIPKAVKYKPPKYHKVSKLKVVKKKNKTARVRVCKINTSFNIKKYTLTYLDEGSTKTYENCTVSNPSWFKKFNTVL